MIWREPRYPILVRLAHVPPRSSDLLMESVGQNTANNTGEDADKSYGQIQRQGGRQNAQKGVGGV